MARRWYPDRIPDIEDLGSYNDRFLAAYSYPDGGLTIGALEEEGEPDN